VRRLYYKLSLPISRILGLKLTPGVILVCRGIDENQEQSSPGREGMK
jgi:hypothetical protein